MSGSKVSVQLLSQRILGRSFQLAALGAVYDIVSTGIRNAIIDSLTSEELVLSENELKELGDKIAGILNTVCSQKQEGQNRRHGSILMPKIYSAGVHDWKILSNMGIRAEGSRYIECRSVSEYSRNINSKGINKISPLPMILRAHVFSKYRDLVESELKGSEASIWLGIAGALISMIGAVEIEGSRYEIYLLPSGSSQSIQASTTLYGLIYSDKTAVKFWNILRSIYREEARIGLSLEIAVWLSLINHISQEMSVARRLSDDNAYESFTLIEIDASGKRQQVMRSYSLILSRHLRVLDTRKAYTALWNLRSMIARLGILPSELINDASRCIATCVHEIYKYLEIGNPSLVISCLRDLVRFYRRLQETPIDEEYIENVKGLLSGINNLISGG